MKSLVISLSFLFLFISSLNSEPVLDTDGDEVEVGQVYYISSAIWGAGGGGISPITFGNEDCPITVGQEPFGNGLPVQFSPAQDGSINISSSLIIKFIASPLCAKSSVLQVGSHSPTTRSELIEIGGVEGKPSCDTFRNWFKIEKSGMFEYPFNVRSKLRELNAYKLSFDPSDICDTPIRSYDVVTYRGFGKTVLGLGNRIPFVFVIRKASASASASGGIKLPS